MNISLYREFYKQWKASGYKNQTINDAIKPWRWVFLNCPKGTQNTYIDGVKILDYLINKETDAEKKDKLVDTLMMLYDQRIQYFGKEGYVLGRKGVDLYKYRPEDYESVFNALSRSIELEGNKSAAPVLVYFFRSAVSMVKNGKADTALIVDSYISSNEIIEYNMDKYAGNQSKLANWEIVKGNIELTFEPYATCEDLIPVYRKKFEETPDDIELLKKITEMLDKKKCQEDPLFFETSQKLYELEPTPESAYLLGKMLLKEGNFSEAVEYFKQTEEVENEDLKARAFKYMAEAYRAMKQFSTARSYALQTASLDPEDGEVYILIGDMYAESAKDCGDNDLTNKVAYWAAVDKYYMAKKVDPELSELANRRISSYSLYYPTLETIFFYDLKEGDEYTVECWINEKTTVRAAKTQ
jgi:tetratricopeptide (TPR) repeat protein